MGVGEGIVLVALGAVAGVVAVIAGGSGILIYPGLVFMGLSPIEANATTYVALQPAIFVALWMDRRILPPITAPIGWVCAATFIGTICGGLALRATGDAAFRIIVPALIGFATALYWAAPELQRRFARAAGEGYGPGLVAAFFATAAYSGYFGTGYGVMLLGLLTLAGVRDYLRANHLKNIIGAFACVGGAGFFLLATSLVSTPHATAIILGNVAGGAVGARLMHTLRAEAVRRAIIVIGCALTAIFAQRYWIAN